MSKYRYDSPDEVTHSLWMVMFHHYVIDGPRLMDPHRMRKILTDMLAHFESLDKYEHCAEIQRAQAKFKQVTDAQI